MNRIKVDPAQVDAERKQLEGLLKGRCLAIAGREQFSARNLVLTFQL
jgi:hypothetical protein